MNKQVVKIFQERNGTAADMTHQLCVLGKGDMGTGICNLWLNGCSTGIVVSAVVLCGGFQVYRVCTRKRRNLKTVETVGTAFNAGFEVGRRQEREFQKRIGIDGEEMAYEQE